MLQLLDGDRIQLLDVRIEVPVLFQVEGAGGCFSFEMSMIDEDRWHIPQDFGQPRVRNLLAK